VFMGRHRIAVGQSFGKWVVKAKEPSSPSGSQWLCECECGTSKVVSGCNLTRGTSKSCGCLRAELLTIHGGSKHELYPIWIGINARCYDPTHIHYSRYGGRGISVDPSWSTSFSDFKADVLAEIGPRISGTTLDRVDNELGYVPGNIRWSTGFEQATNKVGTTMVVFNGVNQSLARLCKSLGTPTNLVRGRLKQGWAIEKALTTPSNRAGKTHE
jgi:hypothetical protein